VKKPAHGVRKIAAVTAALNGASVPRLMALFGWTDAKTAMLYIETADRERMGLIAGPLLANDERTMVPAPGEKVRAPAAKTQ